jgi:hypothetical protein
MGVLDVLMFSFVKWRSSRAPAPICGDEQRSPVDAIVRLLKDGRDAKDPDGDASRPRDDDVKQVRSSLAAVVPDAGQSNSSLIEAMDPGLDGDAIAHWRDEPDTPRSQPAAAE